MTEYDVHEMWRQEQVRNKLSAVEFNGGLFTYYFADGTREIWKRNRLGRLYKFKKRGERYD